MLQKLLVLLAALVVSLFVAQPSWAGLTDFEKAEICRVQLTQPVSAETLAAFRAEILEASAQDAQAGRRWSHISSLAKLASRRAIAIDSQAANGRHVISLGSGPDVHTPLYAFPLARHIHLVDILRGWGGGPADVFSEIENRLRALHPEAKLTIADDGLLQFASRVMPWKEDSRTASWVESNFYTDPVVWKIEWESKTLGTQTRFIWLHVVNFHFSALMQNIVNQIGPNGLGGIILMGIGLPNKPATRLLTEAMVPGGQLLAEMFYFNAAGKTTDPEASEALEFLSERFDHQVLFESTREMREARPRFYLPSTYLFTRR